MSSGTASITRSAVAHRLLDAAAGDEPLVRGGRVLTLDLAGRDALLEQRRDLVARLVERSVARVLQQRAIAPERRDVGDAPAHQAGAQDRDGVDGHAPGWPPRDRAQRHAAGNASGGERRLDEIAREEGIEPGGEEPVRRERSARAPRGRARRSARCRAASRRSWCAKRRSQPRSASAPVSGGRERERDQVAGGRPGQHRSAGRAAREHRQAEWRPRRDRAPGRGSRGACRAPRPRASRRRSAR